METMNILYERVSYLIRPPLHILIESGRVGTEISIERREIRVILEVKTNLKKKKDVASLFKLLGAFWSKLKERNYERNQTPPDSPYVKFGWRGEREYISSN